MHVTPRSFAVAALVCAIAALQIASSRAAMSAVDASRTQSTQLISKPSGLRATREGAGGTSTNAVISNDKRYARLIAFESTASNLVGGDTNGVKDVFAVKRAGRIANDGGPWRPGRTILISRAGNGDAANGPSFSPAVDGGFHESPSCVAFLSAASNLVRGDTNGTIDAFVSRGPGRAPVRLLLPGGRQPDSDASQVAVSGDCSRLAFVSGSALYVNIRGKGTRLVASSGRDPSFSAGLRNDLVFGGPAGVYLSRNATARARLVAPDGRNPAYNDIKRQVVAYERTEAGHSQVFCRDLGRRERMVSARDGQPGDGDSIDPVIGNSGYYISFQSEATNLSTNAGGSTGDKNGQPDVYLYTGTRDLTLVQSVQQKAVPLAGGGQNPSMSFYANYILFDSPSPLGGGSGEHQVYMRYLGGL